MAPPGLQGFLVEPGEHALGLIAQGLVLGVYRFGTQELGVLNGLDGGGPRFGHFRTHDLADHDATEVVDGGAVFGREGLALTVLGGLFIDLGGGDVQGRAFGHLGEQLGVFTNQEAHENRLLVNAELLGVGGVHGLSVDVAEDREPGGAITQGDTLGGTTDTHGEHIEIRGPLGGNFLGFGRGGFGFLIFHWI